MTRKPRHRIPENELQYRFSRSSGPGGQSVNTTESKVEVRWRIASSAVLDDVQKERVTSRLAGRLSDGVISVVSKDYKSQHRNREAAKVRLEELIAGALTEKRRRRPTRPTQASNERRLEAKRRRGEKKRSRSGQWE